MPEFFAGVRRERSDASHQTFQSLLPDIMLPKIGSLEFVQLIGAGHGASDRGIIMIKFKIFRNFFNHGMNCSMYRSLRVTVQFNRLRIQIFLHQVPNPLKEAMRPWHALRVPTGSHFERSGKHQIMSAVHPRHSLVR